MPGSLLAEASLFFWMEKIISLPAIEKKIINFWRKNKIYQKSLRQNKNKKTFSFYDGPPFASGSPHYGHILASLTKDAVTRYWSLRGFNVRRRFGWDCHGLPVELYVEKKLGLRSKRDIFNLAQMKEAAIAKFNQIARASVFDVVDEWLAMFSRIGRWGDYKVALRSPGPSVPTGPSAYATMDNNYIESVWWVFKELWQRNLIYQDYRVMPYCWRCGTPLSNFEVDQGYQEIESPSLYIKFQLQEHKFKIKPKVEEKIYLLVWTTTAWTLPANFALAVSPEANYLLVKAGSEYYIFGQNFYNRFKEITKQSVKIIQQFQGRALECLSYRPLAISKNNLAEGENLGRVYTADFVAAEEGTSIVHLAPFGPDDFELAKKHNLAISNPISREGVFVSGPPELVGQFYLQAVKFVLESLRQNNNLFSEEKIKHNYPHCWRCDEKLIYYPIQSFLIKTIALQEQLMANNKKIFWVPPEIGQKRFGDWLKSIRDWAVSRNRFWGAPIPVWICRSKWQMANGKWQNYCEGIQVIGSVEELKQLAGKVPKDLHRPDIDKIVFKCDRCGGQMRRVEEVLDCWFESGAMPYAQYHYPFEHKQEFEKSFPADFIAESIDQTRGWFYTLLVLSTALFNQPAFKNVIVFSLVLDAAGRKLSKKLGNYPDPNKVFETHGADGLRYFMLKNASPGEAFRFDETNLKESARELILPLFNALNFFVLASTVGQPVKQSRHILDQWLEEKIKQLQHEVNQNMLKYDLRASLQFLTTFVNDDLNNWYIKLSRERLKFEEKPVILGQALVALSISLGPFLPFLAEHLYQNLRQSFLNKHYKFKESVFLEEIADSKFRPSARLAEMNETQRIVSLGWKARQENNLPLRLPLYFVAINRKVKSLDQKLIQAALNVKAIKHLKKKGELTVELAKTVDEKLRQEKQVRDFIRHVNGLRREKNFSLKDKALTQLYCPDEKLKNLFLRHKQQILVKTLSQSIHFTAQPPAHSAKLVINDFALAVKLVKRR